MYNYKAFISYRHIEPDMTIAKKLHIALETYKIPNHIKKQKNIDKVGRVFRDQEELPLSSDLGNDINEALINSEWLIVICTPSLLESKWCMKEIDTFIELGKREKILTVLLQGTPETSFPKQLREIIKDGQVIEIEPLAANVVADSISKSIKLLNNEKIRLLAPLLNVTYDDLKQRDAQRKTKQMYSIFGASLLAISLFASYVLIKNNEIKNERNSALIAESKWLTKSANEALELNNPTLALQLALEALPTSFNNPERPVVDETIDTIYGAMFAKAQDGYKVISTINLKNKKLNYFAADYRLDKLYLFEEKQDFIDVYSINSGEYIETLTDKKSLETTYALKSSKLEKFANMFDGAIDHCYVRDYVVVNNQEKEGANYYDDNYLIKLSNIEDDSINLIEVMEEEIIHHYHYANDFVTYNKATLSFGSSFDGQFVFGMSENNLVLFKASDEEILKILNYKDVGNFLFEEALISADKPLIAIRDKGGNGYIYNYLTDTFVKLINENHTVNSLQFNFDSSKILVLNDTGNTFDIYSTETGEMLYTNTADFDIDKISYGRLNSYYGSTYSDELIILKGSGVYQILRCDVSSTNDAITAVSNTTYYSAFHDYPLISNDGKTLWNYYFEGNSNANIGLHAIDIESDTVIGAFKTKHTYFKEYGGLIKGNYFINYYYDNDYTYYIDIYDASSAELLYSINPDLTFDGIETPHYSIWHLVITDDLKTIIMDVSDLSRDNKKLISLDVETGTINYKKNIKDISPGIVLIRDMYIKDEQLVVIHGGYINTANISIVDIGSGDEIKLISSEEREENNLIVSTTAYLNFNNRYVCSKDGYLTDFETDEQLMYLGKNFTINSSTDDGTKLVVSTVDRTSSSDINSGSIYIINILDNQTLIDSANKALNGKTLTEEQKIKYFLD